MYKRSPLPFIGQKRQWAKEIINIAKDLPKDIIVIDLFGGSGLLSHIIKRTRPDLRVIWNDYDNFFGRCMKVEDTNKIRRELSAICLGLRKMEKLTEEQVNKAKAYISSLPSDSDFISVNTWLSFAGAKEGDVTKQKTLYNNIAQSDYFVGDYFEGLERVSMDYKDLLEEYKDSKVFIVADPPYMMTGAGQINYTHFGGVTWTFELLGKLSAFPHILFSSSKSDILALSETIKKTPSIDYSKGVNIYEKSVAPSAGVKYTAKDLLFVKMI